MSTEGDIENAPSVRCGGDSRLRALRLAGIVVSTAALVVLAVNGVATLLGAVATGIGWDEAYHVNLDWVQPYYEAGTPGVYAVYGYSTQYFGHFINVLLGHEELLTTYAFTAEAYAVRHVTFALLSYVAVICAYVAAEAITRSRVAGVFAAAALTAVPVWSGHGMMNPKDVPVAVGYTLFTTGLVVLLLKAGTAPRVRFLIASIVLLAAGIFIATGFRLAFVLPLAGTAFLLLAALAVRSRRRMLIRGSLAIVVGFLAGFLLIVAANPYMLDYLGVGFFREMVFGSQSYPWEGSILFNGREIPLGSESVPRSYWATVLFLGTPVLIFLFALVALVGSLVGLAKALMGRWIGQTTLRRDLAGGLVVLQATGVPLAMTLTGGNDYDMQRHHLYVYPAVAILAGVGFAAVLTRSQRRFRQRDGNVLRRRGLDSAPVFAAGLAVLALLVPTIEGLRLYPYSYVYVNPTTLAFGGVNGQWETDYWGLSVREAMRSAPERVELTTLYGFPGNALAVYSDEQGADVSRENPAVGADWVVMVPRGLAALPEGCVERSTVTRQLRGESVRLAVVATCDSD